MKRFDDEQMKHKKRLFLEIDVNSLFHSIDPHLQIVRRLIQL